MSAFKTYTERTRERKKNRIVNDICELQRTIDYYEVYFEQLFLSTRKVKVSSVMKDTHCDGYVKEIYNFIKEVNGL